MATLSFASFRVQTRLVRWIISRLNLTRGKVTIFCLANYTLLFLQEPVIFCWASNFYYLKNIFIDNKKCKIEAWRSYKICSYKTEGVYCWTGVLIKHGHGGFPSWSMGRYGWALSFPQGWLQGSFKFLAIFLLAIIKVLGTGLTLSPARFLNFWPVVFLGKPNPSL